MKSFNRYRQLKKISTATLLEEANHINLILTAIISIAILITAFIVWANFTTVKETANAFGEVVPNGPKQIVQSIEGGSIRKVYVKNGDVVKEGQTLLTLSPTSINAELAQLQSREVGLESRKF